MDFKLDIVSASLIGTEILNLRRLSGDPAIPATHCAYPFLVPRRIESRPYDHREDEFVAPVNILERVEILDVHIDPLARLDIRDRLREDVRTLLREETRDVTLA